MTATGVKRRVWSIRTGTVRVSRIAECGVKRAGVAGDGPGAAADGDEGGGWIEERE